MKKNRLFDVHDRVEGVFSLLVSVVAGAHHGAHGRVFETHFIGAGFEHLEGVRVHVALDRQMGGAGCQVLADGQHLDVVVTHVLHDLQHFFIGLAQADHDAAFGRHIGVHLFELFEKIQ